jgi:hypothetical protein
MTFQKFFVFALIAFLGVNKLTSAPCLSVGYPCSDSGLRKLLTQPSHPVLSEKEILQAADSCAESNDPWAFFNNLKVILDVVSLSNSETLERSFFDYPLTKAVQRISIQTVDIILNTSKKRKSLQEEHEACNELQKSLDILKQGSIDSNHRIKDFVLQLAKSYSDQNLERKISRLDIACQIADFIKEIFYKQVPQTPSDLLKQ